MIQAPPIHFRLRTPFIQLDQLLKACHLCSSGGEAHSRITRGEVLVDGQPESRKRAKLRPGQTVSLAGQRIFLQADCT